MRFLMFTVLAFAVLVSAATVHAQGGPPVKERYLIVLNPPKNGLPDLSDHDITAGGGEVEYKVPGRIQVLLPAPAVEALRKHGRVKYIQKVILGPLPAPVVTGATRLTPSVLSLHPNAEATPPTWSSGTYRYDASGNIYAIGVPGDSGAPVQHRYAYDELSRLKKADTITSSTYTEKFTYDAFGNLIEHVDGSATTPTPVETSNSNRLQPSTAHPYTYDAAGNLTGDYNIMYSYDPFNMLREKDSGIYFNSSEFYIYTASDERIGVKYGNSDGPTVWSIRDFSGNVLRQYEGHDQYQFMSWLWLEDYVYRDGQLLAGERVPEEGGRRHFHLDHLGSPRLVTGQDTKEMSEHDFEPFGMESNPQYQETAGGFDREDPKKFTGHERDYAPPGQPPQSTAYLDYMHARYYSPGVERFLSVDPVLGDSHRPQSWNRYVYASNNPVTFVDPNGEAPIEPALLQFFRAAFGGASFSDVDVREVKMLGAGLTLGNSIFLDSRNWKARNPAGISLLAHELDHNVEQRQTGLVSFIVKYDADIGANQDAGMSFENAYVNSASEQRARVVGNHVNAFLSDPKNRDIAVSLQKGRALNKKQLDRVKKELAPVLRQQSANVQVTCTDAARTNCQAIVQAVPVR
jgi:RHS repeat-associated protein